MKTSIFRTTLTNGVDRIWCSPVYCLCRSRVMHSECTFKNVQRWHLASLWNSVRLLETEVERKQRKCRQIQWAHGLSLSCFYNTRQSSRWTAMLNRFETPTSGVHLIRCSQYVLACLSEDVGCFVRASSCPLCTRTAKERLRVLSASTSPLHYSVGGQRDLTRAKMTKQSSLDSFFLRGHALWKRNTAAAARKTQSRENWKRSASATFPLCDIVLL